MRKALDEEGLHPNWAHVRRRLPKKIRAGLFASQKWLQAVWDMALHIMTHHGHH
jgi:hypothetical protein